MKAQFSNDRFGLNCPYPAMFPLISYIYKQKEKACAVKERSRSCLFFIARMHTDESCHTGLFHLYRRHQKEMVTRILASDIILDKRRLCGSHTSSMCEDVINLCRSLFRMIVTAQKAMCTKGFIMPIQETIDISPSAGRQPQRDNGIVRTRIKVPAQNLRHRVGILRRFFQKDFNLAFASLL